MSSQLPDISGFIARNHYTQQELADLIGCSRSRVGMWVYRKQDISREDCAKLLELGMTIEELFGKNAAKKVYSENNKKVEVKEDVDVVMNGLRKIIEMYNLSKT